MTAHFITGTSSEIDLSLRAVLMSARGSIWQKAAAVLMKGLHLGMTADEVRLWIRLNGKATFADGALVSDGDREGFDVEGAMPIEVQRDGPLSLTAFVDLGTTWRRIVGSVQKRYLSSTSFSVDELRDVRLDYARWMFADLLVPVAGMEKMYVANQVNVRAALAAVSKMHVEDEEGRDSVLVAHDWLATKLGDVKPKTAGRCLEYLVDLNLLTQPRRRKGLIGRYRLRKVRDARLLAVQKYEDSVVAYVDGTPDALAAIIKSVDHPLWGYSGVLDHSHWLVLLSDAAEVPVQEFGVSAKREREIRTGLDAAQLSRATAHRQLIEILDGLADDTDYGRADSIAGGILSPLMLSQRAWVAWQLKSDARKLADSEREAQRPKSVISNATGDDAVGDSPVDTESWYVSEDAAAEAERDVNTALDEWNKLFPLPHSPQQGDPATVDARDDQFVAWLTGVHAEIVEAAPPVIFIASLGEQVTTRMLDQAYAEWIIRDAIRYITEAPAGAEYASYLAS